MLASFTVSTIGTDLIPVFIYVWFIYVYFIRGLLLKFVDKSYNVLKSKTILIKCTCFEICTPIQSKSLNNVSKSKRF